MSSLNFAALMKHEREKMRAARKIKSQQPTHIKHCNATSAAGVGSGWSTEAKAGETNTVLDSSTELFPSTIENLQKFKLASVQSIWYV
jgi:hypothetical protein